MLLPKNMKSLKESLLDDDLVEKTDKMEDIQIYQSMFGQNNAIVKDDKTTINFVLNK